MSTPKTSKRTNPNFESNLGLVVSYHPVKFQTDRAKHLQVRDQRQNFKMAAMAAILFFFQMAPTSKTT